MEEGGPSGGGRSQIILYDCEKAWPSINYSVLSACTVPGTYNLLKSAYVVSSQQGFEGKQL